MRNFNTYLSFLVMVAFAGPTQAQENHDGLTYNGQIGQIINEIKVD